MVYGKVLEKFPNDFGFQEDISRNNYVPEHILKKLACSEYWEVRSHVISNNNVTFEILKMLQSDKEPRVLISIKEKLKRLGKFLSLLPGEIYQISQFNKNKKLLPKGRYYSAFRLVISVWFTYKVEILLISQKDLL